jgi:predicted transcriptional regulator
MPTVNNLASERIRLGLSQTQAANELDIGLSCMSKYENNPMAMPGDFIVRAARFYQCSADYLLGISNERCGARL